MRSNNNKNIKYIDKVYYFIQSYKITNKFFYFNISFVCLQKREEKLKKGVLKKNKVKKGETLRRDMMSYRTLTLLFTSIYSSK